jgi:hypothetical protein
MNRRTLLAALAALVLTTDAASAATILQLFKDPSCDCCAAHAAYLRERGYTVDVIETGDLQAVKDEHGIPLELAGCHTILVEGYVVEGHVPAGAIDKLVAERPAIKGIALPGMPLGSPGMSGEKAGPFEVVVIGVGPQRLFYVE